MTEQIRKDFEKWAVEERGYSVERFEEEPHQYVEQCTHVAWTAWKASRKSLVIDLPSTTDYDPYEVMYYYHDLREILDQQGANWK